MPCGLRQQPQPGSIQEVQPDLPVVQGYGCICSPCVAKPPATAASAFGGLRVSGFAVLVTVLPSLLVVGVLLACFYTIRRHRLGFSIPNAIAYSELQIGSHSEVLGEGAHGLILKGTFCGVAVSCKRLLPPSNPAYPSPFDFEVNAKKSLDFAHTAFLVRTNSQALLPSPTPSRRHTRRSSFLELVADNLQLSCSVACSLAMQHFAQPSSCIRMLSCAGLDCCRLGLQHIHTC